MTLILLVPLAPPAKRVRFPTDGEREKPGAVIASRTVVEFLAIPEVPVMVIG